MLEVVEKLKQRDAFDVAIITLESAKDETSPEVVLRIFVRELRYWLRLIVPSFLAWVVCAIVVCAYAMPHRFSLIPHVLL